MRESVAATGTVRLAHISDVHLRMPARWHVRDFFTKRVTGWLNLRLTGRGQRFAAAAHVLARFVEDVQQRQTTAILFSGDATALGFEEELAATARILRVGDSGAIPGI